MSNGLTKEECKKILFKVGIKFGVSPKLISERLLSDQDKGDMVQGVIPISFLEVAVKAWQDAGMPVYADGQTEREVKKGCHRQTHPQRVAHQELSSCYRKPFVRP